MSPRRHLGLPAIMRSEPSLLRLVARGVLGFDHSMNPIRINTSGIPDDVLGLITAIVLATILACTVLVLVTNYRDKVKDQARKESAESSRNVDTRPDEAPNGPA